VLACEYFILKYTFDIILNTHTYTFKYIQTFGEHSHVVEASGVYFGFGNSIKTLTSAPRFISIFLFIYVLYVPQEYLRKNWFPIMSSFVCPALVNPYIMIMWFFLSYRLCITTAARPFFREKCKLHLYIIYGFISARALYSMYLCPTYIYLFSTRKRIIAWATTSVCTAKSNIRLGRPSSTVKWNIYLPKKTLKRLDKFKQISKQHARTTRTYILIHNIF
jgi:hypothetical protein